MSAPAANLSRRTIVAVALAMLIVGLPLCVWQGIRVDLDRSLDTLLRERLHLEYRIVKKHLDPSTDAAGMWWVLLDDASRARLDDFADPDFARCTPADSELECEFAYHRRTILERLAPTAVPESYEMLGAEIALGSGSICPDLPCNIAIFAEIGRRNLFVKIWKI